MRGASLLVPTMKMPYPSSTESAQGSRAACAPEMWICPIRAADPLAWRRRASTACRASSAAWLARSVAVTARTPPLGTPPVPGSGAASADVVAALTVLPALESRAFFLHCAAK